MSTRRELISHALEERFDELSANRISRLSPDKFQGMEQFVTEVRERLQSASPAHEQPLSSVHVPESWASADTGCLSSFALLSLGRSLQIQPERHPAVDSFLEALKEVRGEPQQSFQMLTERYACPLNFCLPDEAPVREYVLMRLMVHARARIEKVSVGAVNSDDLLLKLNFIALNASRTTDLRFLDALNYYYELLPADWQPQAQHNWLIASFFALYAQALAAWLSRK